jgi:sec-independent protein translocase protein TatA
MGAMSIGHWLIVLVIVLVIFGPKRLGNIGKGLGEGMRGLREGLAGKGGEDKDATDDDSGSSKQIPGTPSASRDATEGSRSA